MAAITFPSNPTVGEVNIAAGIAYKWDGTKWTNHDAVTPWVRPATWPVLATIPTNVEKIICTVMVNNVDVNLTSLSFQGDYVVDWGDGSAAENCTSGQIVTHNHLYANVGYLTDEGYKIAVITVTPASGQHLTSANFREQNHNRLSRFLEIKINAAFLSTLILGAAD